MKNFLLELLTIRVFTALVLVLTFGEWLYYRGNQPMDIPQARGIIFWKFVQAR